MAYACSDSTAPKEPTDAIKIAIGETRVIDPANAATVHVSGGPAGAEYTLITSYTPQDEALIELQVSADGVTEVSGPPTPRRVPRQDGPLLDRAPVSQAQDFAIRLGTAEREQLSRYVPAARAAYAAHSMAAVPVDPPPVGSEMQLNVSLDACGPPELHTARVKAVSDHAIFAEDEANPSGGFNASDYDSMVHEFETLSYPVLTENFGVPSDVDNNGGRIIVLFTSKVNELTPPGSSAYIGGFSYARDLVPKVGAGSCAGSNEAELIYLMAPDPTGVIGGNVRETPKVRAQVGRSVVHSGQALINDGHRLYVTHTNFEEPWLKEGLSDIAEELLFYRAAGVGAKQNFTLQSLRASTTTRDAVNAYQIDNLFRLLEHLHAPESSSPTSLALTLENSGAAWSFLRYIADHGSIPEPTLWRNLVDAHVTGIANVAASAGVDVHGVEHQWAASQYADDAGLPIDAALQQPSWNFRDVLPALDPNGTFPLATHALADGSPTSIQLKSGGATYVRFAVPASQTATLHLTGATSAAPNAGLALMLLRTK